MARRTVIGATWYSSSSWRSDGMRERGGNSPEAMRALLALQRAGVEIPDDAVQNGMAGIAGVGIDALGRLSFHEVEYLLDEMFECIQIKPDPKLSAVRDLIEDDIEEVKTRLLLRKEVLELHLGFSLAGNRSK